MLHLFYLKNKYEEINKTINLHPPLPGEYPEISKHSVQFR